MSEEFFSPDEFALDEEEDELESGMDDEESEDEVPGGAADEDDEDDM